MRFGNFSVALMQPADQLNAMDFILILSGGFTSEKFSPMPVINPVKPERSAGSRSISIEFCSKVFNYKNAICKTGLHSTCKK